MQKQKEKLKNKVSNLDFVKSKNQIIWGVFVTVFIFGGFLFGIRESKAATTWKVHIDMGIGTSNNTRVSSMAIFNNLLYVGIGNSAGAQVFKEISEGGFANVLNFAGTDVVDIPSLKVFNNRLYVGTKIDPSSGGAQIWRSTSSSPTYNSDWEIVASAVLAAPNGFGDDQNLAITAMEVFNNYLYIGTEHRGNTTEVWRSQNGIGDWSQVNSDGFGVANNKSTLSLKVFGGWLFASTYNRESGGQVRRYNGGSAWGLFNGSWDNSADRGVRLETFGSYLYAGTERSDSTHLRMHRLSSPTSTSWTTIIGDISNINDNNTAAMSLYTYSYKSTQSRLVIGTYNATGAEIWESSDGTTWDAANSVKASEVLINSSPGNDREVLALIAKGKAYNNHLYAGILNFSDGAKIWKRNWPPQLSISTPSQQTDGSGKVQIEFEADDYDGDIVKGKIEYKTSCFPWHSLNQATLSTTEISSTYPGGQPQVNNSPTDGYQISNIYTSATNASSYTIFSKWLSKTDQPSFSSNNVCTRVTLFDSFRSTTDSVIFNTSSSFTVDNVSPNPPTLNPVSSPTKDTPQVISGTKDANSSVVLNGNTIVSVNANTIWSYSLGLLEGENGLSITSKDYHGNESSAITSSIILDQTAPSCSVSPASGTYAGEVEVKIKTDDALDPDPYIYYTTDGSIPTSSSPKAKDKKTLTFDEDTTLKFFCQDWVGNKTSVATREYKIVPPQMVLTKSAATSFGGQYPVLSLNLRDVLLPTPKRSLGNVFAALFSLRDFLIFQTEKLNLSQEILFIFLRGLSVVILGLTLVYLFLVFDTELRKKKSQPLLAAMKEKFNKFSYALPIVLVIFVAFHLLLGFSLIAQNEKVKPKEIITYTLTYENIEKKKATQVVIYDPLPDYVDYLDGGNLKNNQVEFDIGTVLGESSGTVQFNVKVKDIAPHQGQIVNEARGTYGSEEISFKSNTLTFEVEATGRIFGYVFYDSNANKLKDSGESGISGAKLLLYRDSDNDEEFDEQKDYLSKTVFSASSGYYDFSNISSGTYFVKSEKPSADYQLTNSFDYQMVKLSSSLDIISDINFGYLTSTPTPTPTPTITPTTTITPTVTVTVPTPTPTTTPTVSPTPFIKKITEPVKRITEPLKKTTERIKETIEKILPKKVTEVFKNPQVQKPTKNIFTPLLAALPILNLFLAFPSSISGQFLRYLLQIFSEPFLYFGRRARRGWGVVYDSLSKQPVDLATVRLYDKADGKLLESKVTDFEGRYIFIVDLGKEYYLEVKHRDYEFPSKFLARQKRDLDFDNLYFGQIIATGPISDIRKKEQGIIAFNVPLDPKGRIIQSFDLPHKPIYSAIKTQEDFEKFSEKRKIKENRKILLAMTLRRANYLIGFLGPILALVSLILIPSWPTFFFFILHLIFLAIFLKLAHRKKILPWGKTYELKTKQGLPNSVVRLFDEKYGRLLSVAVTKSQGRYGFLAGREQYVVIPHKPNYSFPQKHVIIKPTRERIIKEDLGMEKKF